MREAMMQVGRRLLHFGALGLGLGLLALLLVARLGTWQGPWPLPLLDTFALYAFVPFGGVVLVALITRSRSLGLLGLAALLFFGQQYGTTVAGAVGLTSRTTAAATPASGRVRVLTLNVQAPNDDPRLLLGLIRDHRPDVLVLQELMTAYARALDDAVRATTHTPTQRAWTPSMTVRAPGVAIR